MYSCVLVDVLYEGSAGSCFGRRCLAMDKVELPMLHSLTPGSVAPSLDTLSESTRHSPRSEPPPLSPLPEEEEEEEPNSPPASPEQEVVDVESHQPCVVDLTNEDEDDVDVVAVVPQEQSIIYLGTEQRRSSRRRRNITSTAQPPALEDVTHEDRQQNSVFESGGDTGGREDGNNILNLGEERQQNWLMEAPPIDFHNPNLVFGNLLDDFPMGSGEGHIPRRPNPLREIRTRNHTSKTIYDAVRGLPCPDRSGSSQMRDGAARVANLDHLLQLGLERWSASVL
ncbi:uncharacterized protein LOC127000055 [Eriocheir sinensis]|uniref:uncharacterized protein LOC127000055 n=1 Tax=Eriocheir sinensis TaxID=95602 RepID=UPI0021C822E3|nr:uncharacterized protein LOC127000055 [Eriocheir sinensis]